ncbi:hypothetical protein C1E24_20875 [Pseudoalteromonas phenolica]|uniref:Lipoprotein n=1 Tax=Pseudoalteromonas phenolica TaxID=161398 RepID=A0A5R9PWQ1_9GAMM|nr:hypothetical protein C1E24_20875 [Pseudoalteromonas phenolica]
MEKLLRFLVLFFVLVLTSSCGVIECVDSQFERESVAIDGESGFEVVFSNGESKFHSIKCEKYYDSMCAERGNSWRTREVGKSGEYKRSYMPVSDKSGIAFELELPNCEKLIKLNSQIQMEDISITWNRNESKTEKTELGQVTSWLGKRYNYVSTKSGVHSFKSGGYRDVPLEIIELEFTLKLNGTVVE